MAARASAAPVAVAEPSALPQTPSAPTVERVETASERSPASPAAHRIGKPLPAGTPVYRDLQAGEHRLEGVLERIACAPEGAAFVIRTTEGPARLTAARMDTVDFITYREDLKGSVSCGALAEPARVYVTWRQGADGARTVIAIEFLPN
jgi:hypothetical protein